MDNLSVGKQIALLRANKGLTQAEIGERLGVSFQAVSKWERGETLPDISLLPLLSDVLETTIDNILLGSEKSLCYRGRIKVEDIIEGLCCLKRMGELMGKENIIYLHAIDGINTGMNTDIGEAFINDRVFEAFVAEAVIQSLKAGYYVDITDINRHFKYSHFRDIVRNFAKKYGIS
ncbi:MAG: helix-turn-helix transcriptional regulator [Clostridia bacterium]|nr:helix-turn-helix transcriptional regulator [Clostridia bacterium]